MTRAKAASPPGRARPGGAGRPIRERVLDAAFAVFRQRGFPGASTLEIATRAQVSKRDLYALFDDKHAMLAACIMERARRMRLPLDPAAPVPPSREALAATLVELGVSILRGVCHPDVLAIYRLAIAESDRTPEIARALDSGGREANQLALSGWLAKAQAHGLIGAGDPAAMAARYFAALWGNLLIQLLLRVRAAPTTDEIEVRARAATEALLMPGSPPRSGE
jgi:AcrR family transcriptional regulator